ncbi:hypothetical protein [Alkalibacillus salilacus]|uniref:Uncharacterized protein n=1 Tax=Alkalibacillus salilacus TaxID=284582 RepID=A0ABT9VDC0_9BACI|nr:hypothetical protein [Alkalibacillus salilacus]MDQ0158961.1 hypothetical protein [Alkalibacillus salilacus]
MNVRIRSLLEPIGLPVAFITSGDVSDAYIIFNYWSTPLQNADNVMMSKNITVQVDLFTKGNFINYADQIHQHMTGDGFMFITENHGFDEDLNKFRKTLRYSITKNEE